MEISLCCKTIDVKHLQNKFETHTKNLFQKSYLSITLKAIYIQGAEI